MAIKSGIANTTTYVQNFINTSFDQVLAVYNDLTNINLLAAQITAIQNIGAVSDLTSLESSINLVLANPNIAMKAPCRTAGTNNLTLANEQTVDGIAVVAGDRVLAKDQTAAEENGIYLVVDGGNWTRTADFDNGIDGITDVVTGTIVPVNFGTANELTWWSVSTTGTLVIGVTELVLVEGLTNVTVAITATITDESSDATNFVNFTNAATGNNNIRSNTAFTYNAATGSLGFTIGVITSTLLVGGDTTVEGDLILGTSGSTHVIRRVVDDESLVISGGITAVLGGNILMRGGTGSQSGDVHLRSGPNTVLWFDESQGALNILTGVGNKDPAVTWDNNQNAGFKGDVDIETGNLVVTLGTLTVGGTILSDTDSTDDLGTTGIRFKEIFVDEITVTDQMPVIQVVNEQNNTMSTTTALIPWDDTIPQNTEGAEFMTLAITPKNSSNILVIEARMNFAITVSGRAIFALFQDSTADALLTGQEANTVGEEAQVVLTWYMVAGTTSATTFKIRAGAAAASTLTFNGRAATRYYGGTQYSSITITEYKV